MNDIDSIKIIKNFIDKEDIVKFISYIDLNINKFKTHLKKWVFCLLNKIFLLYL